MRRLSFTVVAATLIVLMHQGGIPAASAAGGGTGTISYLALGDSVAFGFQPGRGETNGYVGRLWRRIRQEIPALRLRNVSCPGETSRSMITGEHSRCHYAAGSQLDAAVSFLEAHPGEVAFITIDIGANDLVARCLDWDTGLLDKACVVDQRPRLQTRLTRIVDALTAAGPGVPIVGMTYYNPLLGLWGLVPGGRALARADQRAWAVLTPGSRGLTSTPGPRWRTWRRPSGSTTSRTPSWCVAAVGSPSTSPSPASGRGSARRDSSPTCTRTGRATGRSRARSTGSSRFCCRNGVPALPSGRWPGDGQSEVSLRTATGASAGLRARGRASRLAASARTRRSRRHPARRP